MTGDCDRNDPNRTRRTNTQFLPFTHGTGPSPALGVASSQSSLTKPGPRRVNGLWQLLLVPANGYCSQMAESAIQEIKLVEPSHRYVGEPESTREVYGYWLFPLSSASSAPPSLRPSRRCSDRTSGPGRPQSVPRRSHSLLPSSLELTTVPASCSGRLGSGGRGYSTTYQTSRSATLTPTATPPATTSSPNPGA